MRKAAGAVGTRAGWIAASALIFCSANLSAQGAPQGVTARSGDTGSVNVTITNRPDSTGPLTQVHIDVSTSASAAFQIDPTSKLGPLDIAPGASATFNVEFTIKPLSDGSQTLNLSPTSTNPGDDLHPPLKDFSTNFTIDSTPPEVVVYDENGEVVANDDADGSLVTDGVDVDIDVEDWASDGANTVYGSGPGRLEIWSVKSGVWTLLTADTDKFDSFKDYTTSDIPLLGSLPPTAPGDKIAVVAYDQLNNATTVYFSVSGSPPSITVSDTLGRLNYQGVTGIISGPFPSSLDRAYPFNIFAATGATLNTVTLTRDGIDVSSLDMPSFSTGPFFGGNIATDQPGVYTLTAVDSSNQTSQVSWRTVGMSFSFTKARSLYLGQGVFSSQVTFDANSSLPVVRYSPAKQVDAQSTFGRTSGVSVSAYDSDGNASEASLGVTNIAFPVSLQAADGSGVFVATSPGHTEQTSSILFGDGLNDGAVIFSGASPSPLDPTFTTFTSTFVHVDAVPADYGSGTTAEIQEIGTYSMDVDGCTLLKDDVFVSSNSAPMTSTAAFVHSYSMADHCTVNSNSVFTFKADIQPQTSFVFCGNISTTDASVCISSGVVFGFSGFAGGSMFGQVFGAIDPPFNEYVPGQSSATLAFGLQLTQLDLSTAAILTAGLFSQPPTLGFRDARPGVGYSIAATPFGGGPSPQLNSPMKVAVNYGFVGLTPAQESSLVVLDNGSPITPNSVDLSSHTLVFTTSHFGNFKVAFPTVSTAPASAFPGFSLSAAQNATVGDPQTDPRYPQFLNVLASRGIYPLAGRATWSVAPSGVRFSPAAVVQAQGQQPDLTASGLTRDSLFLGQYSLESGGAMPLFSVHSDLVGLSFSALLNAVSSSPVIGIFGTSSSHAQLVDLMPPKTSLFAGGTVLAASTVPVTVTSTMTFSLSARDPPYGDVPASGLAETRFAIDSPDQSTSSAKLQSYLLPFSVNPGTHSITFFSRDLAGNYETPQSVTVVFPRFNRAAGGLGLGLDNEALLWSIAIDGDNVSLAHNDANGVMTASAPLAGADSSFPWTVLFDSAGAAYAVGSAFNDQGVDEVAVYKASPAGDAIASMQLFDSGFNNNNFVFGVAAPGWIVGAVQTAGPADGSGDSSFASAIWKFNPATGLIQLTTSYARAGTDLATGLSVDEAGNLWIAGFSQSPNPYSDKTLDLYVSKYAPDGHTRLTGPFIRRGYLAKLDGIDLPTARVLVSSGTVYVTSPRLRGAVAGVGDDVAFLTFREADGALLSENAWRPADLTSIMPSTLVSDPGGSLLVAGSYSYPDGTLAGFWRYGPDGSLTSAAQGAAGGAQGAIFNGSNLWMTVDGSTSPYFDASESAVAGGYADILAPRVSIATGTPSFGTAPVYVTSTTLLGLSAVDDAFAYGDGLGIGAARIYYVLDHPTATLTASAFSTYASSFTFATEGLHQVSFYGLDQADNVGYVHTSSVAVDLTAPTAAVVSSGTLYAVQALDPVVNGAASGIGQILYLVDATPHDCDHGFESSSTAPGSCGNMNYAGPFSLAVGTHTVYYNVVDNVGNGLNVISSSYVVVASSGGFGSFGNYSMNPTTGPIGIPFTITGPGGFGTYAGAATEVLIGGATAPLSLWNDTTINGTIPGLSTGTYPVTVQISTSSLSLGFFSVLSSSAASLSTSAGPIGTPFTITGSQFGPYAGMLTRVLIGGATAPLGVWNDSAISGSIPGLSAGSYPVSIQRATADGGLMNVTAFNFAVTVPTITAITPSSGPIGATFSLAGASFGPYAGAQTQVLINGATVPLSLWNDTSIAGTVPGGLAPGTYPVVAERLSSDGGLVLSNTAYFQVVGVRLAGISPSTGPIGIPFTINGSGFGVYGGANTLVLLGGTTAALAVWNDSSISGTVPALSTGAYPVYVERIQGASTAMSCIATFTVTALAISSPTPSDSPIGAPFTLTGTGFGPYDGANTAVLFGDTTAQLSVWNDTTISGTVPTLASGTVSLSIGRRSGAGEQVSNAVDFHVVRPAIASISPSSGPIGAAFTLSGTGFGPYGGASTQVLFNGTTAALTVWSNNLISGTIPGSLAPGDYDVRAERFAYDGGVVLSGSASFTVVAPSVSGISTSTGAIGIPFTITGSGFGAYGGANTQIFFGGVPVPLSLWNDSTVSGTVPALSTGAYGVTLQRQQGGYVQSAFVSSFTVILPHATALTPDTAPIGASFTIAGTGFGPYAGANTVVLIGGATAPLSVWNDTQVSGTVPGALAASSGSTTITLERIVGSSVVAVSAPFTVELPVISTMTPNFGPNGTGVSVTGTGFGPYAGAATSLLLNGTTVPLAVWNDTNIVWTVPDGFPDGTYPLVVQLSPADGGVVQSASATFTVGTGGSGVQSLALAATPLSAHPDWYFAGGMNLPATQDNKIQTPSQAGVVVSSGALAKDTVVTVANARSLHEADRTAALVSAGLGAAGEAISFGPEGTQFAKPVTITLPYDPNLVPSGLAGTLAIGYFDPAAKSWTPLDSTVDTARHLVSAKTSHFSLYQPLGVGFGVSSAAQDVFGLRAFYVFPNPARGTNLATFRVQPGLADSVEVRVYDVTGRKVHSSTNFTANLIDDGNGLGAQDTYDHVWDLSGVGSGVYTYVITAKKAGSKDIHVTGKVGVIK